MKKTILVLALLFAPLVTVATENVTEVDYDPAQAKSITYKITLYREDAYDKEVWNGLVSAASTAIKRAELLQNDGTAATNEIVDAFVHGIEEIYKQNNTPVLGVHGQMGIEIADEFDDAELE